MFIQNTVGVGLVRGQKITGQSSPDWLKMTSPRTSKPNSGDLSGFCSLKIGRK